MEFISSAVLSGILYDLLKNKVLLTAGNIKESLKGWAVDQVLAELVEQELVSIEISDQMSEGAIASKIEESSELMSILSKIPQYKTQVTQQHTGSGANVAGDKIVNNG